jgi:uncharacterized protein YidB (DUF937 family)
MRANKRSPPLLNKIRQGFGLEAIMGLMDVLRGMQYGPHGQPPSRSGTGSGTGTGTGSGTGMSPITMAILGLLAYKALKSMSQRGEAPAGNGGQRPAGRIPAPDARDLSSRDVSTRDMSSRDMSDMEPRDADMGRGSMSSGAGVPGAEQMGGQGSIGDLLKGALGGLLAGSAAGGIMSGGLNDLLRQLQKQGLADTVDSWVGSGENKAIAPGDLAKVLGADQIDAMMQQSGLSREELLDGLSKHLPEVVNRLTPEGEVPRHIPM